jgi:hypothetical protein
VQHLSSAQPPRTELAPRLQRFQSLYLSCAFLLGEVALITSAAARSPSPSLSHADVPLIVTSKHQPLPQAALLVQKSAAAASNSSRTWRRHPPRSQRAADSSVAIGEFPARETACSTSSSIPPTSSLRGALARHIKGDYPLTIPVVDFFFFDSTGRQRLYLLPLCWNP